MGRKSKLSEKQWADVDRRLLEGESPRSIAKDYPVTEAAIRQRKTSRVEPIKNVANQIVSTERALSELPIASQIAAQTLAAKLRSISDNLASAAELGAKTAHRLTALANSEVAKVEDAEPLKSVENLKGVAALTKLANDSAAIALNLVAANKETIKRLNEDEPEEPSLDPSKLSDSALAELMDARRK